ncbi:MAG: hypothetical protein KF911_09445 [Pseudomonadales bacterium]|nr:hypothetical protein [Pseudomonadales bacterium]
MKAGMTLRLPTEEEARALSQAEALEQVALQDRAWRGESVADAGAQPPPAAAPAAGPAAIDASPAPASAPAATETAEGRLRIVAGAGDSPVATVEPGAGETTVGGAPAPDLAAALEERDRLAREVSDLASQLDREKELAANQLAVKDRLLEVKDQQMAEVEAELARLREAGLAAAPAQSQDQNARRDAPAWWQSPLVMGAGAGVVVLLLAVALVAARRRRAEQAFAVPARAAEPQVGSRAAKAPFDARARAPAAEPAVAGAAGFATGQGARAMAAEPAGAEFSDVIAEADVYLTYGRHGQAAGLLQSALENDPMRQDVRLKLLEVLAAAGDRAGFDTELTALRAQATDPGLLEAATALAASFGAAGASHGSAQVDRNLIEYDVELFPERADSAADTAADATVVRAAPAPVAGTEDIPDLEIDLGGPVEGAAGARLGQGQAGDPQAGMLGGDLGIDFRLDDEAFRVEADDLEALDDTALAREMDGLPLEEEAFEFADEGDSASTKLDLARAYNEMGDAEGAREILLEVLKEGSTEQQQAAQELLARL